MTPKKLAPGFKRRLQSISLLVTLMFLLAASAHAKATLTQVRGEVEIGRGEPAVWKAAQVGAPLAANERIRTGPDGRAEVQMDAGIVRVHENSMLRLPAPTDQADRVALEKGHSLFDVLRRGGRLFEVHTPSVVVSVKGTRFGVDASDAIAEVTVFRGVVGVRDLSAADAVETLVREGFFATGGNGLPIELDVSLAPDLWERWQDWNSGPREPRQRPARMGEMERAKATLHRATAVDIITTAANRRPEIAKRLRQLQAQRSASSASGSDTDAQAGSAVRAERARAGRPMPASPDLSWQNPDARGQAALEQHLDDELNQSVRDELSDLARRRHRIEQRTSTATGADLARVIDLQMISGAGGLQSLNFPELGRLTPDDIVVVIQALRDLEASYSAAVPPATAWNFINDLQGQLANRGMTDEQISEVTQILIGR